VKVKNDNYFCKNKKIIFLSHIYKTAKNETEMKLNVLRETIEVCFSHGMPEITFCSFQISLTTSSFNEGKNNHYFADVWLNERKKRDERGSERRMTHPQKMRFNHFIEIIVKKFNYVMQITSTKNIIKNPQTSEVPFSPFFHPLTLPGYPHRPWGFIGNTIGITPKWQSYLSTNWSTTYFPIIFMVFDEVIFDKVSNSQTKRNVCFCFLIQQLLERVK